jgi:hypothetical protein
LTRKAPLALATSALLLVFSAAALADSAERAAYREAVEPICKANKQASDRYLNGVRDLVRRDKLKPAAQRFTKAAAALEKAQKQLATVAQPPADTTKLGKWLAGIKGEVALMRTIAAKLRQGDKGKASSLAVKLQNNATKANNQVIVFQFDYCKINPSAYS